MRPTRPIAAMLLLTAAACSSEPESAAGDASPATVPSSAPRAAGAIPGASLDRLSGQDFAAAALPGELGCSFTIGRDLLLVAKGDVASAEPARGIIKPGNRIAPISMAGGFDAMDDGGTFAGRDVTVRIRVTGPAVARGEAPARPATLTAERSGQAIDVRNGLWQCGP